MPRSKAIETLAVAPSWEITAALASAKGEREAKLASLTDERDRKNCARFILHPQAEYSRDEAGELLGVRPDCVSKDVLSRREMEVQMFDMHRVESFIDPVLELWKVEREEITEHKRPPFGQPALDLTFGSVEKITAAIRQREIRRFFTQPKDRYTVEELERLYGPDIPDVRNTLDLRGDENFEDRKTAAGFLKSFVSPVVVGRALAGIGGEFELERREVELPRWLWRALEIAAESSGNAGPSDVIAEELLCGVEVGISAVFGDALESVLPDYSQPIDTPEEAPFASQS